jgi:hypothetical protein
MAKQSKVTTGGKSVSKVLKSTFDGFGTINMAPGGELRDARGTLAKRTPAARFEAALDKTHDIIEVSRSITGRPGGARKGVYVVTAPHGRIDATWTTRGSGVRRGKKRLTPEELKTYKKTGVLPTSEVVVVRKKKPQQIEKRKSLDVDVLGTRYRVTLADLTSNRSTLKVINTPTTPENK